MPKSLIVTAGKIRFVRKRGGEYAMIQAAAAAGYIDREAVICESAVCMYRAGADLLITYFAMELAKDIREGRIG